MPSRTAPTPDVRVAEHPDPDALADALAQSVATSLTEAIEARGLATLVVPGGRTPVALFRALARIELPWSSVMVTLTDERRVPADDPQSNAQLVRTHLLTGAARAARFVPLASDPGGDAAQATRSCSKRLAGLPRPYDVVILGMGGDGHTASLFPGRVPGGPDADCAAVTAPVAPEGRLTQSATRLAATRRLIVYFTGRDKRAVFDDALAETGTAKPLPIAAVARQADCPVELYWADTREGSA
ncbi:6-phosphogluconolactonase [wastewater metagenome]|uniref:6-phosphogluconolactonase n=2 Tax=unclassified sequences TaxID=12908 RepID=A0A5B8RFY5_9ZZZZ|nr:6-phosphogluconolactonase [Arhodomonas sp. KWT]QEA06768.1 6-phosphogluconolactonase [uncultured organism]